MICYALSLAGFGLLISSICATQQQAFLGVFAFMMPAILLSGYASPVDNMPGWLQITTLINPLRHFIVIVKGIFLKGVSTEFVLEHVWPLILISIVTLSAANWIFRRQIARLLLNSANIKRQFQPFFVMSPKEPIRKCSEIQQLALDFVHNGEIEALAPILRDGLPVNLSDAKNKSLLMLACSRGHLEIARLLLLHRADVDRRDECGQTPLGVAALRGDTEMVSLLLEYGADIDADGGFGMTPIMLAFIFGKRHTVEQLRTYGGSLQYLNFLSLPAHFLVCVSRGLAHLLVK